MPVSASNNPREMRAMKVYKHTCTGCLEFVNFCPAGATKEADIGGTVLSFEESFLNQFTESHCSRFLPLSMAYFSGRGFPGTAHPIFLNRRGDWHNGQIPMYHRHRT
jgi:hypothetical protein